MHGQHLTCDPSFSRVTGAERSQYCIQRLQLVERKATVRLCKQLSKLAISEQRCRLFQPYRSARTAGPRSRSNLEDVVLGENVNEGRELLPLYANVGGTRLCD